MSKPTLLAAIITGINEKEKGGWGETIRLEYVISFHVQQYMINRVLTYPLKGVKDLDAELLKIAVWLITG